MRTPDGTVIDADLELAFLGAAGEVTGSCFLVTAGGVRFLVDCGMFQGGDADAKNAAALRFDGEMPEFVVVTHAHIDHSGLLPLLAARGFRGPVYATPATVDLLGVMLPDSAYLQEKDAERSARDRRGERDEAQAPAPLYTVADAARALQLLQPRPYDREFAPARDVRVTFRDAGHILGSAIVEVAIARGGRTLRLVFSGDLGQPGRPVMDDPTPVGFADTLVVESTYGDRLHKSLASTMDEFVDVLTKTLPRGNVVVPAFAVGRTQEVLHVLADLVRRGRAPDLSIFVDSPLAQRATEITAKYAAILDRESRDLTQWLAQHRDRVRVRFTETPEDSMAINAIRSGAVIVAASGMCEGGRVRHHLRHNLPRSECAVVFTGFQAAGTLGRRIVDGAATVRLFRDDVPVRASVHTIGGLSAHADQAALLGWLSGFRTPPRRTFVVHGEAATAAGFAALIRARGWPSVAVPQRGERIRLG
ncbi:MAG TPA: MBL fold metallo-hydrolase [Casimicrobiaceae bacterium]|jgi:metallo-beta-lactamase family protein|nr:MBL fold metallo-hydrolase [Casimicrobiaceae bacterium]